MVDDFSYGKCKRQRNKTDELLLTFKAFTDFLVMKSINLFNYTHIRLKQTRLENGPVKKLRLGFPLTVYKV